MNEMTCNKTFRGHARIKVLGITTLALLILVQIVSAAPDQTKHDLTGVWNCDDTGTYYLKQIDNDLYWYGESDPVTPSWSNVAHGTISGNTLNLEWEDVPKGNIMQNGILALNIVSNDELKLTQMTGGFGGSHWTRSGTTPSSTPVATPISTPEGTTTPPQVGTITGPNLGSAK